MKEGTKDVAEAVLRELPSVIGAFVREDVHGHPREVHLLVRSGPSPKLLAYDVRELLEERLGVPVDQRIISIAQLADGRRPGPILAGRAGLAPPQEPAPDAAPFEAAAVEMPTRDARVRLAGLTTETADHRVRVTVTLEHEGEEHTGAASGLDSAQGRLHAAAGATLQAVNATCVGRARFEVEQAATLKAFDREYVMVAVLASSAWLGRQPLALVGAHPIELDGESAAALAALKAINRTLPLVLRLPSSAEARRGRAPRRHG
jgi:hypothetical protein